MTKVNELQQRLAVAAERNRTNEVRRAELLAEAKEKLGCSSVEELEAKVEELRAAAARAQTEALEAEQRAESAVSAVEAGVRGEG